MENSLATGWSDPVKWNGVDGRDGPDGAQGHTGRWYYYAGEWSSRTYTMEETQSPYVKGSDGNFYMLDFGTGGLSTGSTTLDPATNHNDTSGSGTEPWTLMASTMQYYIAKAFFGDYAQFGSFIINGDWLLSTKGTKNGAESQDYYSFDPSYPNTSVSGTHTAPNGNTFTGYNFVPNFAVDGLTGKTYQNDAYVRGEVHATSGVFSGLIKKTPTVVNSSNISNYTYTTEFGDDVIDFEKIGTYIVFSDLTANYFMNFRGIYGYRSTYTAEEKDYVRSMIGNKVLVYNKSSYSIYFSGFLVKDGTLISFNITRNQMCFLECKIRKCNEALYPDRDGYEEIYWDCVQMNID